MLYKPFLPGRIPPRAGPGRAFTLVELLIVISIISLILGLLLPAVQQARASADRLVCANNLKQIGLALHHYHTHWGYLPPSRLGDQKATWAVLILPFLEQDTVYRQWQLTQTYYQQTEGARRGSWKGYVCPTRRTFGGWSVSGDEPSFGADNPAHVPGALSDYAANIGTTGMDFT